MLPRGPTMPDERRLFLPFIRSIQQGLVYMPLATTTENQGIFIVVQVTTIATRPESRSLFRHWITGCGVIIFNTRVCDPCPESKRVGNPLSQGRLGSYAVPQFRASGAEVVLWNSIDPWDV